MVKTKHLKWTMLILLMGIIAIGYGRLCGDKPPTQGNISHVATGYSHTVALKTNGTLWAWGNNLLGQLGDGTTITKNVPTQVNLGQ